jgi:hypothetical protein
MKMNAGLPMDSGSVTLTRYNPSFLIDIAVPEELRNSSGKIIFRLYEGDMKTLSSNAASKIFPIFDKIIPRSSKFFSFYALMKDDVKLLHASGEGWAELPTKSTYYFNSGDSYLQFEAYTPKFSRFIVKMEKRPVTCIFFVAFISLLIAIANTLWNGISKYPNRKKVKSIFFITFAVIFAVIFVILGVLIRQFLMLIMLIPLIVIPYLKWHKEKKRPLFDWEEVSRGDEGKVKDFFINSNFVRVEDKDEVKIQKAGDDIVIKYKNKEYATVKLNVEQENGEDEMKTKATITIEESGKSYDLKVKKENGKQNIYLSLSTFIRAYFPSFPDVAVIAFTIAIVVLSGLLLLFIAYLF